MTDLAITDFRIGQRVEISPACDLWMRGARCGEIRRIKDGILFIKMDNPRVRRQARVTPQYIQKIGN
jgi:hypothetical protein